MRAALRVVCASAADLYCAICFRALHLKGSRAKHVCLAVQGGKPVGESGASDAMDADFVRSLESDIDRAMNNVPQQVVERASIDFLERAKVGKGVFFVLFVKWFNMFSSIAVAVHAVAARLSRAYLFALARVVSVCQRLRR